GDEELRIVALHRRRAKGREEVRGVDEKAPRALESPVRGGQIELPWHVADQLAPVRVAGAGTAVVRARERFHAVFFVVRELMHEEGAPRVPQFVLYALSQGVGACVVRSCGGRVAEQRRRAGDGARVTVQVAVQRR